MGSNFTPTLKLEHSDARGEIYSISLPGDQELLLLHSKEGSLRGGHSHTVDEIVVLLIGGMAYHKLVNDKETVDMVKAGQGSFNRAGLVHLGEFTQDSWLIEWKLNTRKGEWRNVEHAPWREKVAHAAG